MPLKVFVSYAHEDALHRERLGKHLGPLEREGLIQIWHDRKITGGRRWDDDINASLREADIALFLVSKDFLHSEYCNGTELKEALRRDAAGQMRVVPLILTSCDWEHSPLSHFRALPDDGAPVLEARHPDKAFKQVALSLRAVVGDMAAVATAPVVDGGGAPHDSNNLAVPLDYSRLEAVKPLLKPSDDEIYSVAFCPRGRIVAAASHRQVVLWDLEQPWAPPFCLTGPSSYIYCLAFSPDGRYLACGGEDKTIHVWDMDRRGAVLWKDRRGRVAPRHDDAVYSVAFSDDGQLLASGGYDHAVKIWHTTTGDIARKADLALSSNMGRVSSVAFAPGGQAMAIGSLDNHVRLWDLDRREVRILAGHDSSVEAVAISRDGSLLASGGLDKTVRMWDLHAGRELWKGEEHEYLVRAVAFSPDGATLASASWDKTVRFWDARKKGRDRGILMARKGQPWHSDWIWSVAFSSDGRTVATGGSDGQLLLWRAKPVNSRPGQ